MKLIDALAADYWIDNTDRIYEEDLHVSSPVMDAYRAGFLKALAMAANYAQHRLNDDLTPSPDDIEMLGDVEALE